MLPVSKPELCAFIQWFFFTFEPVIINIFFLHISSYLITEPSKALVYFTKDGIVLFISSFQLTILCSSFHSLF